jgi:hypothetical protein
MHDKLQKHDKYDKNDKNNTPKDKYYEKNKLKSTENEEKV